MPNATATKLNPQEIANVMSRAGWPTAAIPVGVAVALGESSGNPTLTHRNRNGSTDYGLFQINSVHGDLLKQGSWSDPVDNAKMALKVYQDAGNSWRPWVVYNSGSFKRFYNANLKPTGSDAKDDGGLLGGIKDGAGDTAEPVADAIGLTMGFIGDKAFWTRFGIGLLAVALIIIGVVIVFRQPIGKGVKMASNLTPQGRAVSMATGKVT